MRNIYVILGILLIALSVGAGARASTIFVGGYPYSILAVDEGNGAVTHRIQLTGVPRSLQPSMDKKTIYVTTPDRNGIEIIDIASRKVIKHFDLNTPTTQYRMSGGVPDPTGKLFYALTTQIDKKIDRYEVGKPKFTVVDLVQGQITKTFDIPKEDEDAFRGFNAGRFQVSKDGKYIYSFGEKVIVLDATDFKVVDRIDLAKPDLPGIDSITFGGALDTISEPGYYTSVFNAADPYIHTNMFGIARFDLGTRQYTFTIIGPAPTAMSGLQVAPNKKDAYVVVANGTFGNKRCEFWHFDLTTNTITERAEFQCRSRLASFGISGDGKKLYIFGATYQIEVYDAATLKFERAWDMGADVTGAGMVRSN